MESNGMISSERLYPIRRLRAPGRLCRASLADWPLSIAIHVGLSGAANVHRLADRGDDWRLSGGL